jgi:hypothetical protein
MNKKPMVARVISRILDPFIVFFFLMIMATLHGEASGKDFIPTLFVIVVGILVPPMLLLLWAVRTKKVSNWDVSNRRQRVWVFLILFLFLFLDVFIIKSLHNHVLSQLYIMFLISFIGMFLITLFWKISGHLSTLAITIGIVLHWYGFSWWPLLVLLPLLSWSRVVLQRHTTAQTIGGSVYGLLVTYIASLLGFV